MNTKCKGIFAGLVMALLITAAMSLLFIFVSVSKSNYEIYPLILVSSILGGVLAAFVGKVKTIKDAIIVGYLTGVALSIFWILICIMILSTEWILSVWNPHSYEATLSPPQAFLMNNISRGLATSNEYVYIILAFILISASLTLSTFFGSYSYYLFNSIKRFGKLPEKSDYLWFFVLLIVTLGLIFSKDSYLVVGFVILSVIIITTSAIYAYHRV